MKCFAKYLLGSMLGLTESTQEMMGLLFLQFLITFPNVTFYYLIFSNTRIPFMGLAYLLNTHRTNNARQNIS
jgi:hypothetical protein